MILPFANEPLWDIEFPIKRFISAEWLERCDWLRFEDCEPILKPISAELLYPCVLLKCEDCWRNLMEFAKHNNIKFCFLWKRFLNTHLQSRKILFQNVVFHYFDKFKVEHKKWHFLGGVCVGGGGSVPIFVWGVYMPNGWRFSA